MPNTAAKLFRDQHSAEKAAEELAAKGFKQEEIGILLSDRQKAAGFAFKPKEVTLPQGTAQALGTLATALAKASAEETTATLSDLLGLPEETIDYYQFGVSVGGILISVHSDEARLPQAQQILREAGAALTPARGEMWASSPGFASASRMSETDPLDAKMTGDFRRY
jgi:hypothetical protein